MSKRKVFLLEIESDVDEKEIIESLKEHKVRLRNTFKNSFEDYDWWENYNLTMAANGRWLRRESK